MALFSAVLNLFMGGEDSPSGQEDESNTARDSGTPSAKAHVSPGKSPLLQKLNRMRGDSVILNNTESCSPIQDCDNGKKRTREILSGDDEGIGASSQKRRRVYMSAGDDPENIERSSSEDILSYCNSALQEHPCSFMPDINSKENQNPRINPAHQSDFELNADTVLNSSQNETETGNSENKIQEKQRNDNILHKEKDIGTSMSNIISSTNSEISQKDEKASTSEVKENTDLSKVHPSLDIKHEHVEKDILSVVLETRMDKILPKSSSFVQQETEEMECTTSESQATSSAIDISSTITSEGGNQPTSSIISNRTTTSEDNNHSTSSVILNYSSTMISEDENQVNSSVPLDDGKNNTHDIDNADDNQLVPDVICKTEGNEVNKLGYGKERNETASGDQVVDENNNETDKTCEEDDMLIAKQIAEGVLTDTMLDQEKKLHQEHLEEEKEIVTKAMEELETTVEKQRYSRLQHLLQKSNVYSEFLLQRIEEQKTENEKRKAREAKKAEKAKKEDDKESPQTVPNTKRGRKCNQKSTGYNITDYVDSEALKKSSQESIAVSCVPDKDDNKNLSIGHHSKENETPRIETTGYKRPQLLTGGSLRDYQIEGVEWLKVLFENGVNGILADEMGLGKTIQCIALIAHLIENEVRGPFLVTAPLSTLPNWLAEFKRFTPGICAMIYHGLPEERTQLRKKFGKLYGQDPLKSFPVAITSYDIILRDRKYLMKYKWKYLIVDEGHRIKNLNCKLIRELKALPAANRLLLTGTPLQNNLSELWSLLNFLLPDIFNDLNSFQAWFDFSAISESDGNEKIIAQEREHHVLERLHAILTPFLLRRLKCDVSLDIPPKKEVFVYAPLTQKQKDWYQLALDKIRLFSTLKDEKEIVPSFTPTGRARRGCSSSLNYGIFDDDNLNYEDLIKILTDDDDRKREALQTISTPMTCERNVKVVNILMLLRKACMHPYLLEYPLDLETQDYRIDEELITCSGKTLILDQMLPELKRRGHKILLFSQMTKLLNILEDLCYIRNYKYSRIDGSMKFEDRQTQIADFNSDPDIFIFLLSTRAGGLGLNLTAADTVIIYDSDWNPQQDLQAQDRCHRIGQTKPVIVYRLIAANTIDQRIVEVAHEKRRLEKMIIHKEKFKGRLNEKKLTAKELKELLQSTDHMAAINSDDITGTWVLSTEQLNKLLDRSDMLPGGATVAENSDEDNELFKVVTRDEITNIL